MMKIFDTKSRLAGSHWETLVSLLNVLVGI